MRVGQMVRQPIGKCTSDVHQSRLKAVTKVLEGIINAGRLTPVGIGRKLPGGTSPRHGIKCVDRLVGNAGLAIERRRFFPVRRDGKRTGDGETGGIHGGSRLRPGWRWVGLLALGAVLLWFWGLMWFSLRPLASDDGVHFYSALLGARGRRPYADFFVAHPPLHLGPLILLARAFPLSAFRAMKLFTFSMAAVQLVCVHAIVRRLAATMGEPARELAAVLALIPLVLSHTFLRTSSINTGIVEATAYCALGTVLLVHGRSIAGGLMAGAAVGTMLQMAPLVAALAGAAVCLQGRRAIRFLAAAAAVVAVVNAWGLARAGGRFVHQVYLWHLAKVADQAEGEVMWGMLTGSEPWMGLTVALSVVLLWTAGGTRMKRVSLFPVAAIGLTLAAVALRPRPFFYYFHPLFLPAAVLIGLASGVAWQRVSALPWRALTRDAAAVGALGLFAVLLSYPIPRLVGPTRGAPRYSWTPSGSAPGFDAAVHALYWQEGTPPSRGAAHGVTEYLWSRSEWLDYHRALVEWLRRDAATHPGTVLFGDFTIAPLAALESGVPIAGDLADTNLQRFDASETRMADVLHMLDAHPRCRILLRERGGLARMPELMAYLTRRFRIERRFGTGETAIAVWARVGLGSTHSGPVFQRGGVRGPASKIPSTIGLICSLSLSYAPCAAFASMTMKAP
jgi:hypothetical protein